MKYGESRIEQRFADLTDAATFSGYSRRQIYEWIRTGLLAAYRPSRGKLLIDLSELSEFIKSQPHNPGDYSQVRG